MGLGDDIKNKAEELKGEAKQKIGEATDNEQAQAEGIGEQIKAKAAQVGESIKDAVEDIKKDLK